MSWFDGKTLFAMNEITTTTTTNGKGFGGTGGEQAERIVVKKHRNGSIMTTCVVDILDAFAVYYFANSVQTSKSHVRFN